MEASATPASSPLPGPDDVVIPSWKSRLDKGVTKSWAPTEEERSALRKAVLRDLGYTLSTANSRVALFVGATRAGKSSLIGMLRSPFNPPTTMSIFSETWDAGVRTFSVRSRANGVSSDSSTLTISCVDTPGLYEVRRAKGQQVARTEQAIMECIGKCLDQNLRKVHCVFLVTKLADGQPSQTDVDTIRLFARLFGETTGDKQMRMAIIVTHAEDYTDEGMNRVESLILEDPRLKDLITRFNVSVLFSGVADTVSREFTPLDLNAAWDAVQMHRSEIIEFIQESKEPVPIKSLSIAGSQQVLMQEKLTTIREVYESLLTLPYEGWRDINVQVRLDRLREAVVYVKGNKAFLNMGSLMVDYVNPAASAAMAVYTTFCAQVPEAELYDILDPFVVPE